MIIGNIVGEGSHGIISESPINKLNRTGRAGKRVNIGRSKIPGVSMV
jgi:hypothetical protein